MAILTRMPAQQIIDIFKGTLDFYLWKGIPCVRKWPHYPKRTPTPAEKANQDRFAYANKLWAQLAPNIQEAYRTMAGGTGLTGKDLLVKGYLLGR